MLNSNRELRPGDKIASAKKALAAISWRRQHRRSKNSAGNINAKRQTAWRVCRMAPGGTAAARDRRKRRVKQTANGDNGAIVRWRSNSAAGARQTYQTGDKRRVSRRVGMLGALCGCGRCVR